MSDTVLVVDDDPTILRTLRINLRARNYQVEAVTNATDALSAFEDAAPDVVVLDLGLPDLDGIEVLRRIRVTSRVPVIVLSARQDSDDKVEALDEGADDYVTKPFGMNELLARMRAALRRNAPSEEEAVVATADFIIDLAAKKVRKGDDDVHLTPTEWGIVEMLVRHQGKLVSQRQLLQEVWGPQYEKEANYLRVYMAGLRRKLEPVPSQPRYFITEPGMGYRFEGAADETIS